jgi:hypothetical protein
MIPSFFLTEGVCSRFVTIGELELKLTFRGLAGQPASTQGKLFHLFMDVPTFQVHPVSEVEKFLSFQNSHSHNGVSARQPNHLEGSDRQPHEQSLNSLRSFIFLIHN